MFRHGPCLLFCSWKVSSCKVSMRAFVLIWEVEKKRCCKVSGLNNLTHPHTNTQYGHKAFCLLYVFTYCRKNTWTLMKSSNCSIVIVALLLSSSVQWIQEVMHKHIKYFSCTHCQTVRLPNPNTPFKIVPILTFNLFNPVIFKCKLDITQVLLLTMFISFCPPQSVSAGWCALSWQNRTLAAHLFSKESIQPLIMTDNE